MCGRGALRRLSELRGKLLGWPRGWMSCVLFPFCSFLDGWAFEGFDLRLGTGGTHWWKLALLVRMSCAHDRAAAHHHSSSPSPSERIFWPLAVFFFKQEALVGIASLALALVGSARRTRRLRDMLDAVRAGRGSGGALPPGWGKEPFGIGGDGVALRRVNEASSGCYGIWGGRRAWLLSWNNPGIAV